LSNLDTGQGRPTSGASFLSADEGDPASDSDTGSLLLLSPSTLTSPSTNAMMMTTAATTNNRQANNPAANTTTATTSGNNSNSPDAWSTIASTEMITAENADSVLRNVTNNMWYGIMEEEREREAVAELTSHSARSSLDI
jgi:hypothetical protein